MNVRFDANYTAADSSCVVAPIVTIRCSKNVAFLHIGNDWGYFAGGEAVTAIGIHTNAGCDS